MINEIKGMKFWYLTSVLLLLSCGDNAASSDSGEDQKNPQNPKSADLETRFRQEIESKLGIVPGEKYELKVYKEQLNEDQIEDAIITVNRLDFAKQESARSENSTAKKSFGYMGSYNSFFLYDGRLDKVSIPMNIASSALAPLEVKFENIRSDNFKDLTVKYRIRNSAFRNYYFWQNDQMMLVFQWKLFDQVGTAAYEANHIVFDKGSISPEQDILIYKGKIKNYNTNIQDVYSYHPEIEKQGELVYRFFYDPKTLKYMTQAKAPL